MPNIDVSGPSDNQVDPDSNVDLTSDIQAGGKRRKQVRRINSAERRATHNAVERARRDTLNGRFLDLAAILPNLSQIRRPSKSAIVNTSIAYFHSSRRHRNLASRELRTLKYETDALRRELNDWRDQASIQRIHEPTRSDGFSVVLSGEVEFLPLETEDGEDGEDDLYTPVVPPDDNFDHPFDAPPALSTQFPPSHSRNDIPTHQAPYHMGAPSYALQHQILGEGPVPVVPSSRGRVVDNAATVYVAMGGVPESYLPFNEMDQGLQSKRNNKQGPVYYRRSRSSSGSEGTSESHESNTSTGQRLQYYEQGWNRSGLPNPTLGGMSAPFGMM
jgi:hypothetical protein